MRKSEVVPFKAEHLDQIVLSDVQAYYRDIIKKDPAYPKKLEEMGLAYTGICEEGIVGISGIIVLNETTAEAWALMSQLFKRPRYSYFATKAIRQFCEDQFKNTSIQRIQMNVQLDFEPGHRWARALGFQVEGIMRKYGLNGKDHVLYARVKE